MKVLVACEESQVVCSAFRAKGHDAFSCDILPCSGGHPEWHIQDNVLNHLEGWDMIIAHPPCTYLSNAGARWLFPHGVLDEERFSLGLAARAFFYEFFDRAPKVCIENPIPSRIFKLPCPSQVIEPWMFGEKYSKKTYLWLQGLPPLMGTFLEYDYTPLCCTHSYHVGGFHDSKLRSRTLPGIASAMAAQWG